MPTKIEILERMQNMPVDHLNTYTTTGYKAAIRNLKTILDELEKPVEIEQCLAEWIEYREARLSPDHLIAYFWREIEADNINEEVKKFAVKNVKITNQAILTGNYTVKKEEKFYWKLNLNAINSNFYFRISSNRKNILEIYKHFSTKLSEEAKNLLGNDFDKFVPVPVEGETE